MEDMEKKQFLQDTEMNFVKNFKARDATGAIKEEMQVIGYTNKSTRAATCFVHIISDEEEFLKDEENYLVEVIGKLIDAMNEKVSERTIQYDDILFKLPIGTFQSTMTNEPLINYFSTEDCLEIFTFMYNKDIEEYSDTDQLFRDFPHITEEFLGSASKKNVTTLKRVHRESGL